MEIIAWEVSMLSLLAGVFLLVRRHRGRDVAPAAPADQSIQQSELVKQHYDSVLARLEKSFALLETRLTMAECTLGGLTEAPSPARRDHYQAAALLLAAGHDAGRVAGMLDLPLVHVEMIGDLKNLLASEAKAAEPEAERPAKSAKRNARQSVKPRVRPILLTDSVESLHPAN